ncbi:MAG: cytochrome c biogenesis protein CcsA [Planctomycetota bacterium]|jgi:ABC-type transport system involved in cytochrome c biogenesis permease subunit|nr:cytochrome c biogenesis protein CcsA [Planctomycetota bacterium]
MNQQRSFLPVIASLFAPLLLSVAGFAQQEPTNRVFEWESDTVELFQTLPVQSYARVKPMDSLAGLNLLIMNGKRTLKLEDGSKLKPSQWLLDTMFFPEQAKDYPCFRVQSDDVLIAVDLTPKGKRDWYSYNELAPGLAKVMEEARRVADLDDNARTTVDLQLLKLANDTIAYHYLVTAMDLMRLSFDVSGNQTLTEMFGTESPKLATILAHVPELQNLRVARGTSDADTDAANQLVQEIGRSLPSSNAHLTFMAPAAGSEQEDLWWTFADTVVARFGGQQDVTAQVAIFAAFSELEASKGDAATFHAALEKLHGLSVALASSRGEYDMIAEEVSLYKLDPFYYSLVFYALAFLLCAVTWMASKQRWIWGVAWVFVGIGFILDTYGITMRCLIRHRPPVVTLYDTIIFITTAMVLVGGLMEWITKQRIALPVAALLGCAGMFFAGKYELREVATAGDTMASVVAVLDTNYYLAIHVTTISLGYAGGLLASSMAHVWVIGKLFGLGKGKSQFFKSLTRMTYGVICFSLLFSIFGTIMGGVWANDSWGRFWGWDPKENGALLICLWLLLMLHARLGGYVREHGFMMLTIVGGVVVSASWWGVNMLDTGLHSYGRIDGAWLALMTFWTIEGGVIALSVLHRFLTGWSGSNKPQPPAAAAS